MATDRISTVPRPERPSTPWLRRLVGLAPGAAIVFALLALGEVGLAVRSVVTAPGIGWAVANLVFGLVAVGVLSFIAHRLWTLPRRLSH